MGTIIIPQYRLDEATTRYCFIESLDKIGLLRYIKEVIIKDKTKAEALTIFNYPYAAIEEILSNAVYHRSYQVSEPITVRITPENIEITSFPGFDRSISDESIANYSIRARVYRNRRIGDFLKELHLIEGRNTGFPNAIKALRENGSELLTFDMDENRSYLSVTIPVHSYFLKKKEQTDKKAAYEKKITDALKDKPLTLTELASAMSYKGITKKLTNTVNDMLARNILEKTAGKGNINKLKIK